MLRISRHPTQPGEYLLETELWLPRPIGEVFAFFADAVQLETITPPFLQFRVETPQPIDVREGTLIDYRLRLHGIPVRWRSKISVWEPPHRFVDEQVRGPYRKWHHEHTFRESNGGTLVGDRVEYALPGGPLVHALFVRRDLERIFAFREKTLRQIFAAASTAPLTSR